MNPQAAVTKRARQLKGETAPSRIPAAQLAANARHQTDAALLPDVAHRQHDRNHAHGARAPPVPILLRLPEVERITSLKKSQIYDAIARGIFPRPVHVLAGGRASAWLSTEIGEYIAGRAVARDEQTNKQPEK